MYEAAIQALRSNEPEKAILLIVQSMRSVQHSSERFEMEIMDAVNEISTTQDFLDLHEWRIS